MSNGMPAERMRRAAGCLQREIAARIGISRQQVGKILSGKQWAHLGLAP